MRAIVFDPNNRVAVLVTRLALLFGVLFLWWICTSQKWLSPFFFGDPLGVAHRIVEWTVTGSVFRHLYTTLLETMLAFAIGTVSGLACGLWLALNPFLAVVFDPFIKAMNSMPRLIFAPIFALWFGLGIWSKVALGVTLVFFVVFFNVFQGARGQPCGVVQHPNAGRQCASANAARVSPFGDELGVLKLAQRDRHRVCWKRGR